ncbi:glycosyltransferase family 2 protein [Yersinia enterocolitica]|uniref:Nucleotidyl transferase domain-containing protein n=1 Tax=Yersinia enterocolitica TaxID=630 RepID=A0A0H5H811_YEREN|nr:glycosyltransferase family 2 protein [Yersinia enterocolitica]EKN3331955.1 glycosyltransferase family 2 protein [Yersinia enterocolitica]EKN3412618.1 glycosyltransferase family 2 protein [Yersinia enterocolitica]EKN3494228.1 glycosyltransferase family 2 protein [Yersinia enterocolitica]EKN3510519.1 glycosyltransferase family 2 protein [Yersinia enterocolitica]EKN3555152.1 glycosyltransferase family 2 protein [Yersinia enterocolitica]
MGVNILILAAGQSSTESREDSYPLCLTETDGMSLIERIVLNTKKIPDSKYCFALLDKDAEKFHLDKVVKLLVKDSTVIKIPEYTKGSACTALLAASQLNQQDELLIISANELVNIDFSNVLNDFNLRKLDGGTLIFKSVHPRYSYVSLNTDRIVIEAAQQKPISQNATAGVFWFARTHDFAEAAKNLIRKNASVNEKFYVAPTFNELILKQMKVGTINLNVDDYKLLKTERQAQQFESGF